MPIDDLRALPVEAQDQLIPPDLIHPTRYREFLSGAAGITVITDELSEFNFARRPQLLARPGVDAVRFRPDLAPAMRRDLLGLGAEDFVLVYHGTTHYANQHEMLSLYLAVKLLQRQGLPARLVQVGSAVHGGLDARAARAVADSAVELGVVPWREIPGYLALADGYVQPGAPDLFNRYRLPSKLPEFLAMGRPVILPHCNIGNELSDGENAILLEMGTAIEIASRLRELIADPRLAERLGHGAREFAVANLDWGDNAKRLSDFYRTLLDLPTAALAAPHHA
jgi:glycosyltransferase involved in cell wall biosynthesis